MGSPLTRAAAALALLAIWAAPQPPPDAATFARETERRLRDGEWDSIIYYALQSTHFTTLPPIEPATSAKTWKDTAGIPPDAGRRLAAFFEATPQGERHTAMRRQVESLVQLRAEYARAMEFLYEKEWAARDKSGAALREHVAGLYQTRGHSTDTDVRATYAVHIGLTVLKQAPAPPTIRRVLLIGPGHDWSPRTGLREEVPPQTYQPYALADSLLRLGLAGAGQLTIDAIDINPRVVRHINDFPNSARRIVLFYPTIDEDWNAYFDNLGRAIGTRAGNTLTVDPAIAQRIRAEVRNIVAGTPARAAYDLVVATNVLLYCNDRELSLALTNIAGALRPGGYFLHNDLRPAIESFAGDLGIPITHARTVRIHPSRPLYDAVIVHRNR